MSFKDHFSALAATYADYRPHYPPALFAWLAEQAPGRALAWDCACGSGQAALGLAQHYARVIATDASAQQIATARAHRNIEYRVAPAEASGLEDASVDLVCVAQALHWFDLQAFYAEARRVLRPGGMLATWTYGVHALDAPELDRLSRQFYAETLGPYWPPERRLVETGYRTLPFPFAETTAPDFAMQDDWSLPQLLGYLRSWSATSRYATAHGEDPVLQLERELLPLWSDPAQSRRIVWPLTLRTGYKR